MKRKTFIVFMEFDKTGYSGIKCYVKSVLAICHTGKISNRSEMLLIVQQ